MPGAAAVATVLRNPVSQSAQAFASLGDRNVLLPGGDSPGGPIQGLAMDDVRNYIYTLIENSALTASYVSRYSLSGPRSQNAVSTSTASTDLDHQGLGLERSTGKLWTRSRTTSAAAVRFDYVASSAPTNLQVFALFTDQLPTRNNTTPTISYDEKWLIAMSGSGATGGIVRVWSLATVLAGGAGDYSASSLYQFSISDIDTITYPLQAIISDGKTITITFGYGRSSQPFYVRVYNFAGNVLSDQWVQTAGQPWQAQDASVSDRYWEPQGLAYANAGTGVKPYLLISSGESPLRFQRVFQVGAPWQWLANTFVDNFSAASVSAGVTPSSGYMGVLRTFLDSLITTGVYNYLSFYYPWNAKDGEAQSRIELLNPGSRTLTKVGSPTWTAKTGYTGTGSTSNYLTSSLGYQTIPNYGKNRAWMGFRGLSTARDTGSVVGTTSPAYNLFIARSSTDNYNWRINDSGASTATAGSTTSAGNFHMLRLSASFKSLYLENTNIITSSVASDTLETSAMVFLRSSTASTSNQWGAAWGGYNPPADILAAFNTANDAYIAAVSALP